MKSQLKALFKAMPTAGKLFWFGFGLLPVLAGVLGAVYCLCWGLLPEQLRSASFPTTSRDSLTSLLYGLFITVVCGVFGAFQLRKQRRHERLMQFGRRIDPPITKIEESLWRGGNGGRFYYIYSQWQDPATGKKHTFESERLGFDPSTHLRRGDTLPIYFEPGNTAHYYFDVSSLPKPRHLLGN